MQVFAKDFANTFRIIAFDAEVPTYFKGFSLHHLKTIHGASKLGGDFYLPWQYAMEPDYQSSTKWSDKLPDDAVTAFSIENNLANRQDMFDPIVRLPQILGAGQDDALNHKIVAEIRDKNHLPVLEVIFGKGNVEILKERKLPFSENQGRLTAPPYVAVFLAKKMFTTEQILLRELEILEEKNLTTGIVEIDALAIKPLLEQINHVKANLRPDLSYSLAVLVEEAQLERFDETWIKVIKPCHPTKNSQTLQTPLSAIADLRIIADHFSDTFGRFVFDVETPSLFMNDWTIEHFKCLFQALKPGGTLTLPIHYEWYVNQDKTYPTLEQAEINILRKIVFDHNRFIFKELAAPYTFKLHEDQNEKINDIFTRLQAFARDWHNVEDYDFMKTKLSSYGIRRINESFKIINSNAFLTPELIEIINENLFNFTSGANIETMRGSIEQYFLKPEREDFIKKMNAQILIPYTISYLESIFGKDSTKISSNKNLPFKVIREHMDYVVFTARKT